MRQYITYMMVIATVMILTLALTTSVMAAQIRPANQVGAYEDQLPDVADPGSSDYISMPTMMSESSIAMHQAAMNHEAAQAVINEQNEANEDLYTEYPYIDAFAPGWLDPDSPDYPFGM